MGTEQRKVNEKGELLIQYDTMKWCHQPDHIPEQGELYAILEFNRVWIPADHSGYDSREWSAGSSEPTTEFILFHTKEDWEHDIKRRMQSHQNYPWVPIVFRRAGITTTIKVD